jgi:hypothetical protein
MRFKAFALVFCGVMAAVSGYAGEGASPAGVPRLDRVFVILMENHGIGQVLGNPNLPYTNELAANANIATNYFAIAHPSLTNYLEIVGGSNFGVHSDNYPDWHNPYCTTNLAAGTVSTDSPASPAICPIFGIGTDAATPAIDTTNETSGPPGVNNIDGIQSIPAAPGTTGKTIADQLALSGRTWKSYQESLGTQGADLLNYGDGFYNNNTNFSLIMPAQTPALTSAGIVALYAAKHNPFVYFRSIQEGDEPGSDMTNVVDFTGPAGLYADLRAGSVPTFSFIAPNQCNDQHGRGNAGPFCNFDPNDNGTLAGLNPALMQRGDIALKQIVTSIKESPVWKTGNNAVVVVWDEDDYSISPTVNKVLVIVDTNYGSHGLQSGAAYNHFSLLKSLESGLGLPCLNHACDSTVNVMSDLFGYSYTPSQTASDRRGSGPASTSSPGAKK